MGENPILRALFFRLCQYSKTAITFVFVFNGPQRPGTKRGHRVQAQPPDLIKNMKYLIDIFGFYSHQVLWIPFAVRKAEKAKTGSVRQAPGEAEAELAELNQLGDIDLIITEDSDAFVFGSECVVRTDGLGSDTIALYSADAIENCDSVGFTRSGLILIALLVGGDYDSGIQGVGPSIARGLAKCGFGDQLVDAITTHPEPQALEPFLDDWRHSLRAELSTNSSGHLGHCHKALVPRITASFPSYVLLKRYLEPITSRSLTAEGPSLYGPQQPSDWRPREPALRPITTFCIQHLGWDATTGITKRFHVNLWAGVFFRMLCMVRVSILLINHSLLANQYFPSVWSCMTQVGSCLPPLTHRRLSSRSNVHERQHQPLPFPSRNSESRSPLTTSWPSCTAPG